MINFNIFKGGTRHIVTMSYDDARLEDKRLAGLFNKYGIRATFNVNTDAGSERVQPEEFAEVYRGHEVAVHTVNHPYLENLPVSSVISQISENKRVIEKNIGYVVRGMAYPYGTYNDEVINTARSCGIVYSRTTGNTNSFNFPENFMKWHPTCHHNRALELADRFLNDLNVSWRCDLFYIWGHSFELKTEDDWDMMEKLCRKISGHESVWYASNIEVYDYINAQRSVHISADETIIHNPSAIDVWFSKDNDVYCVKGGETIIIK